MWKAPKRGISKVSESFGDGVVKIYTVEDKAQTGYQPRPIPTLKATLRYTEQRLGIQRYYEAMQNQIRIERVIRVPRGVEINSQDIAVTEDEHEYRIDMVQSVTDVWPSSLDLTLAAVRQKVVTA